MAITEPGCGSDSAAITAFTSAIGTVICDPTANLKAHQYFNEACFTVPEAGQQGWSQLPYIHGPAYFNSDLAVFKTFKVTEKQNVQFRVSAFNFLNHPLWSFNNANRNLGAYESMGVPVWPDALPDYRMRVSKRAKNISIHVSHWGEVEIVIPKGFDPRRVPEIVERRQDWILQTQQRLAAKRQAMPPDVTAFSASVVAEAQVLFDQAPAARAERPDLELRRGPGLAARGRRPGARVRRRGADGR